MKLDLNNKILFVVPTLLTLYIVLFQVNDLKIAVLSVIAIAVTFFGLKLNNSKLFSFNTIYVCMCMLAYPVAALMNAVNDIPAVREDLWPETSEALIGYIVSIVFMFIGARIYNKTKFKNDSSQVIEYNIVKYKKLFVFYSLLPVVAIFMYAKGIYYHSSIEDYNFESKNYLNLLTHILWISYLPIFIQLRNYTFSKSKTDLYILIAIISLAVVIFLPSGSREMSLGFLPLLLICYYSWEGDGYKKIFASITFAALIVLMLIIVDAYRGLKGLADLGLIDKYSVLTSASKGEVTSELSPYNVLAGRLADYVATGRIIATTPAKYNFRGFEGMGDWWQIALPAFLRPPNNQLNFSEGAETTYEYGVSQWESSSTPVMTIGDLFSRFGWSGVVIGSFFIGYILSRLDNYMYSKNELFRIVFFVLFARIVWRLYTASLLINLVSFTRDLLIVVIISAFICNFFSNSTLART